jgi:hypothetical protein
LNPSKTLKAMWQYTERAFGKLFSTNRIDVKISRSSQSLKFDGNILVFL